VREAETAPGSSGALACHGPLDSATSVKEHVRTRRMLSLPGFIFDFNNSVILTGMGLTPGR
jgi:hypothetical protein